MQGAFKKSVRSTGHAKPDRFIERHGDREVHVLERAFVWEELWTSEHCFVGSQNADARLDNATTTPSHVSGHTMEFRLQLDAPTPAHLCMAVSYTHLTLPTKA